jgi:peptidoglycan-N-acetylglucosamine deacetylase
MVLNALSIDVEEWYHAEIVRKHDRKMKKNEEKIGQVAEATQPLLDLLKEKHVKATFFVLGEVAEKNPELVKKIADAGHEIASHGYSHVPLNELSPAAFTAELVRTEAALQKAGAPKPSGFRAPTFSLNQKTVWALGVLAKRGYAYDSSLFPVRTTMYGVGNAPLAPYKPRMTNLVEEDASGTVTEVPLSVTKILGKRVPFGGGFYLRFFPSWFTKRAIRNANAHGRPAVIFLHPWEAFAGTPKVKMGAFDSFVTYHGASTVLAKLAALLDEFEFAPVKEIA